MELSLSQGKFKDKTLYYGEHFTAYARLV